MIFKYRVNFKLELQPIKGGTIMKPYEGKEEYVFVSYSHKDKDKILPLLEDLALCSCNIWYDEGIHSGTDWSEEIAKHLNSANCILFMVSNQSIASEYVKDELVFAKSKGKKILPVFLEKVELPLGIELLLGKVQYLFIDGDERIALRNKIKEMLPKEVFHQVDTPFYVGEKSKFYLESHNQMMDAEYFKEQIETTISVEIERNGKRTTLVSYTPIPAYEMSYSIHAVEEINDPYYDKEESKILLLSLSMTLITRFSGIPYPDLDIVLTIAISDLENEPKVFLLNVRVIENYEEKFKPFVENYKKKIIEAFTLK